MSDYYAVVFGAGICGTAIAHSLFEKGKNVLLIDPYVSENAPGAPAALVNPATGRRAKLGWRGEKCYDALRSRVGELIQVTGREDLISDTGVVRPAINEKLAENFRRALDKYDWPQGWIRWMDPDEIRDFNDALPSQFGGLFVESGYTVYVDDYLNAYRRYLRELGVDCRYEPAEYHTGGEGDFTIRFEEQEVAADHVIVAAGHRTHEFEDWSHLPLEGVKGEIVRFEAEEDLDWEHAISVKGYCMRRGERDLVVGSTYDHDFEDLESTEEAYATIEDKLAVMLPGISTKVKKKDQLAGVRVTTPNRLPVIGRHPYHENLLIYTGMNSKGLLFSHYVGGLLADHLVDGAALTEELDVSRFGYRMADGG